MKPVYRQVTLFKDPRTQVAWIPADLAIKGHYVRFGDDDGWLIVEVSKNTRTHEEAMTRSRDFRRQRIASDA